jgi:solute carrier family 25 phosphate transporter 3
MAAPATSVKEVIQKKPEGVDLYARFALAGALGCSVTHGAFTPVDVFVYPVALNSIPFAALLFSTTC